MDEDNMSWAMAYYIDTLTKDYDGTELEGGNENG